MLPSSMEKLNAPIAQLPIWFMLYTLMLVIPQMNGVMRLKMLPTFIVLPFIMLLIYPPLMHGIASNHGLMFSMFGDAQFMFMSPPQRNLTAKFAVDVLWVLQTHAFSFDGLIQKPILLNIHVLFDLMNTIFLLLHQIHPCL
jgi:hypothetical protein